MIYYLCLKEGGEFSDFIRVNRAKRLRPKRIPKTLKGSFVAVFRNGMVYDNFMGGVNRNWRRNKKRGKLLYRLLHEVLRESTKQEAEHFN